MKIVMVCEFFDPELAFQENLLLKYYRKHGHDVTIITSTYRNVFDYYYGKHDKSVPDSVEEQYGGKIVRLRFRYNLMNKLKSYARFGEVLAAERPDFIFVHDITPDFPAMVAYVRKHPSVKMIMDYHADYSNSGKNWISLKILHGVIRRYFLDRARPHLAKILPIIPAGFTFLDEIYGVRMDEMELLTLGADTDLVKEIQAGNPRAKVRGPLGIPDQALVIVTGGKIERHKRTELLIEAVRLTGRPDIHLLIAGKFAPDDPDYEALVHKAASGIAGRVHFVGWLNGPDMFQHMSASDLAVFPASQSVLWLQAIANGLPLVVGDTGGQAPDYVNTHDNIIILRDAEISAGHLAEVIGTLAASPTKRRAMADGARKATAAMLDYDAITEQTLRFAAVNSPGASQA